MQHYSYTMVRLGYVWEFVFAVNHKCKFQDKKVESEWYSCYLVYVLPEHDGKV